MPADQRLREGAGSAVLGGPAGGEKHQRPAGPFFA